MTPLARLEVEKSSEHCMCLSVRDWDLMNSSVWSLAVSLLGRCYFDLTQRNAILLCSVKNVPASIGNDDRVRLYTLSVSFKLAGLLPTCLLEGEYVSGKWTLSSLPFAFLLYAR